MKKLFVGNLPDGTAEKDLQSLFSRYGTVHSSRVITDIFSGRRKGFGFIEMEDHVARAATAGLNGELFDGNALKVNFEFSKARCRRR